MAIWDSIISKFSERVASSVIDRMAVQPMIEARAYRSGYYKPQLKVKPGQFDDNIGINLTGLLVNRVVSQMIGAGFTLDFEGDTETAQEQYVNAVLDANKQEVLFHRAGISSSEAGTGYLYIIPGGVTGADGNAYPRLQLIDPAFVTLETLPHDYEVVIRYIIQYKFKGADGKERSRKTEIFHNAPEVLEDGGTTGGNTWTVAEYEGEGGRWIPVSSEVWGYDFPPILHWQNLPSATGCYGEPDLTDAQIQLQDRINFVSSNISKLIRYYAHPMRIAYNVGDMKRVDVGADQMIQVNGQDARVEQLAALGDLAASMAYLTTLRQAFFACGRVVDINSISDKLGALTNFGLRVLYADNLSLIATKRELFGDMLEELARRLQVLALAQPIPCAVVWPDFLPVNETEQMTALETKKRMGVMSDQSIAVELGLDWEVESERIEDQKGSEDNVGAALLRGFTQGSGGFGGNGNA